MSDSSDNTNNSPPASAGRRTSFTSQALADLFSPNRTRTSFGNSDSNNAAGAAGSSPVSVTAAAASAQRRRMSISGLGLNGANGTNGLTGFKRTGSVSSHNSNTIDESAVEDGEPLSAQDSPSTSFGRRMSFGARALRDVKTGTSPGSGGGGGGGGMGTNGRSPNVNAGGSAGGANDGGKKTTPPGIKGRDNGYNWADNFRIRAERSASIASQGIATSPNTGHHRAKTVSTMQPPPVQQPEPRPIDHMQERILKGDFYMD